MSSRHYTLLDQAIMAFDQGLQGLVAGAGRHIAARVSPAAHVAEQSLTPLECKHSAGLMRVNHAGEVAAQALYQGQAIFSRDMQVKSTMRLSAEEEVDHLHWCQQRLAELGSHTSLLNPVWYLGSFSIGTVAGLAGDKWSLGFVAETEHQVVEHLQGHLQKLPAADAKSRAIIEQMIRDESAHGAIALSSGGVELPAAIKTVMRLCSKVMTKTAYWM